MKLNYILIVLFVIVDAQNTDFYQEDENKCQDPESKQQKRDLIQNNTYEQKNTDAGTNNELNIDEPQLQNDNINPLTDQNNIENLQQISDDQSQDGQVHQNQITSDKEGQDTNNIITHQADDQTKIQNNQEQIGLDSSISNDSFQIQQQNQENQAVSDNISQTNLNIQQTIYTPLNVPIIKQISNQQTNNIQLINQQTSNDYNIQIKQQGSNQIIQKQTNVTRTFEIYPNQCQSQDYLLYQGSCVLKSCINDKLARFNVDFEQQKNFIIPISIEFQINNRSTLQYILSLKYPDNSNDTLLNDPDNCIDWRLYQTANSFQIDPTRLNVQTEGGIPTWPKANYEFNLNIAYFSLLFTQQDIYDHQCIKLISGNNTRWQCFFEFAFVVQNITQLSYYFSIQVDLDTLLPNQDGTPAVNFNKIVEVTGCPPGESNCVVEITVNSEILFCKDQTCLQTSIKPITPLLVNQPFWLLHQLTDDVFKKNWGIRKPQIMYQSYGFQLILTPFETKIISYSPGYSIYELRVPIVSEQVVITASGELYELNSTRLMQTDSISLQNKAVVRKQIDAGQVTTQNLNTYSIIQQLVQNKTSTSAKYSKIISCSQILFLSTLYLIL